MEHNIIHYGWLFEKRVVLSIDILCTKLHMIVWSYYIQKYDSDFAEDRHWICGSVTEVLTELHHINLVVLKGIKDKVKQHKMTSEKKSEMDQGSTNGMKDCFSLQWNALFKRKMKDTIDRSTGLLIQALFFESHTPYRGEMQTSSTMGIRPTVAHCSCWNNTSQVKWLYSPL